METFSALLAICAGNSPAPGQWREALMFYLICVWINDWVNNREAGDLRRYRAHYDVIVMKAVISEHMPRIKFMWNCYQVKMAFISQMIFSGSFLWMKSFCILIKMSLKFVPNGPIDNNPALV